MDLTFQVKGEEEAAAVFALLEQRLRNPRPVFERAFTILERGEREVFASRGGIIGRVWAALSRSTRRQRGQGAIPLRVTDTLYRSLTAGGPGAIRTVSGDTARFGTGIFYARFVSKRRKIVGTSPQTRKAVANEMRDYLIGAVR